MEMDSYERVPLDEATNQANILLKKKTFGGVPPGAGVRDDVIELFEEMEEGRNTLAEIQSLLDKIPEHQCSKGLVLAEDAHDVLCQAMIKMCFDVYSSEVLKLKEHH